LKGRETKASFVFAIGSNADFLFLAVQRGVGNRHSARYEHLPIGDSESESRCGDFQVNLPAVTTGADFATHCLILKDF